MNRKLKGWKQTKRGEQFQARIVSCADDFVILSRGKANEALSSARATLMRLGLTLNEAKTSVRNARKERFDFLGYTFGPHIGNGAGVPRMQSVEEEPEPNQGERGRTSEALPGGFLGGGTKPVESEAERLESVLRTGEPEQGLQGDRRICG